jgi:hypothetical protein
LDFGKFAVFVNVEPGVKAQDFSYDSFANNLRGLVQDPDVSGNLMTFVYGQNFDDIHDEFKRMSTTIGVNSEN